MKTIEELIIENNGERTFFDNELVGAYFTAHNLEALCKAYMQDKLSELQDVAIVDDASYYDGKTSTYKPNGNLVKQHALDYDTRRITEIPIGTCLYDISSLWEK